MAEIRISDLPESGLTANLSNTIFPVVNLETDITGKLPLADIISLAGGGGGNITVGEIDANNNISNTLASVNAIYFDTSVGFDVVPLSNVESKITINQNQLLQSLNIGTFETILIQGQANLVANLRDTLEIVSDNNIRIRSNTLTVPQQLIIESTLSIYSNNYEVLYNSNGVITGSNTVTTNGEFLTFTTVYPEKVKVVTLEYPGAANNYYYLPPGDGNTKLVITTDGTGNTYWGNPLTPRVTTLPYSANVVLDWSVADVIRVTLGGDIEFTHTGAADGQKGILEVTQPAAASNVVYFTTQTKFGSDIPSFTASTTFGVTDKIGFIYNLTANNYRVVAIARGF